MFWIPCCDVTTTLTVTISKLKRCSVRLYLHWFIGGIMYYLRYLCLLAHSGVLHILWCFVCLRLVYPVLPVSLNFPFLIVHSVSLTFIQSIFIFLSCQYSRGRIWYRSRNKMKNKKIPNCRNISQHYIDKS